MGLAIAASSAVRVGPRNPRFDVSPQRVKHAWRAMREAPRPVARPVVVISGWRSPRGASASLAKNLCILTSGAPSDFLAVAYPLIGNFRGAVDRVSREIAERFPGSSSGETADVDVVGISMGGLVARAMASSGSGRPRVNIKRLFTLATPHRGARLARLVRPDSAARDMKPGSIFLAKLDEQLEHGGFELVCYARLMDAMVGARNAAPRGREPLWVPASLALSHLTISGDPAITVDIARRLRGEAPIGEVGGAPPGQ